MAAADAALAAAKQELASLSAEAADCPVQAAEPALTAHHVSLLEHVVSLVPREVFQNAVSNAGGNAQQIELETAGVLAARRAKAQACSSAAALRGPGGDATSDAEVDLDDDVFAQLESFGSAQAADGSEAGKAERKARARALIKMLRTKVKK